MDMTSITGVSVEPDGEMFEANLRESLSEVGASLRLYRMYGRDLLRCHEFPGDGWVVYRSGIWNVDDDGYVLRLAQELVNSYEADVAALEGRRVLLLTQNAAPADIQAVDGLIKATRAFQKRLGAMSTVKAIEAALRTRTGLRAHPSEFDADPWVVGTRGGRLVDLRTGKSRPAKRSDRIMRTINAEHDPSAKCPHWESFIDEITCGDVELARFLQRALGYSMVGVTYEQVFFLCTGNGANGKSTMLQVIREVIGGHSATAPSDSFVGRRDGAIPNDIARLAGARFVLASETRENAALEENIVKQMTGEDAITARFLNREFFEFDPRFTIWMTTNHKPRVRGSDRGIWRRIKVVPFKASFENERRNKNLKEMLIQESSGILNWLLEGIAMWREMGLGDPPAVTMENVEYRRDEDVVLSFIEGACVLSSTAVTPASDLFKRFSSWSRDNGEIVRSQRWLGVRLRSVEGVTAIQLPDGTRAYKGIRVADSRPQVGTWSHIETADS
jgi:putative DNA primase/helicase